jgi:hypothetical protein
MWTLFDPLRHTPVQSGAFCAGAGAAASIVLAIRDISISNLVNETVAHIGSQAGFIESAAFALGGGVLGL